LVLRAGTRGYDASVGRTLRSARSWVPNAITFGRALLAPVVVVVLLAHPDGSVLAAVLFVASALSDSLDGYLARAWESRSDFGAFADPIADKLLLAGGLLALVATGRLATWIAVVILARELAVTALRTVWLRRGLLIPASQLGKAKATLQTIALVALALPGDPGALWVQATVGVAVLVTVGSGVDYFLKARRHAVLSASP
jgi:CDP-diacylglycerol---glycerol-3-phosphate 3-phosphatidyltransferase